MQFHAPNQTQKRGGTIVDSVGTVYILPNQKTKRYKKFNGDLIYTSLTQKGKTTLLQGFKYKPEPDAGHPPPPKNILEVKQLAFQCPACPDNEPPVFCTNVNLVYAIRSGKLPPTCHKSDLTVYVNKKRMAFNTAERFLNLDWLQRNSSTSQFVYHNNLIQDLCKSVYIHYKKRAPRCRGAQIGDAL